MASPPVYDSQKDSKWGGHILGSGTTTLSYEGCAVPRVAMLLSGYGHRQTPGELNVKTSGGQRGFATAGSVTQV